MSFSLSPIDREQLTWILDSDCLEANLSSASYCAILGKVFHLSILAFLICTVEILKILISMGLFYDINNVGDALKTVANTMI